MPIKGVEQLDIERINSYEDNRFSEKVLRQHGEKHTAIAVLRG